MIVGHIGGSASDIDTGDIQKSLRFAASRSTYLSRTFGTPTDNTTWSFSCFIKRGKLGSLQVLLSSGGLASLSFTALDQIVFYGNGGGAVATSSAVFRDPSAHGNLVVRSNGTDIKAFWNGAEVLSYTGTISLINSATSHLFGQVISNYYLDGYLSRVCFIDGQALTPSSFGYLNTEINEWVSKSQSAVKAVVDAGGANSFMLDFDDGTSLTTLGYDKSSKGNNWTLNNHSLTAGVNYDWMGDVPFDSFAVMSQIDKASNTTISNGNLLSENTNALTHSTSKTSIAFDAGGAAGFTWEVLVNSANNLVHAFVGAAPSSVAPTAPYTSTGCVSVFASGEVRKSGVLQGTYLSYTTLDIVKFWVANGELRYSVNGVSANSGNAVATGLSGDYVAADIRASSSAVTCSWAYNFGQYPFATGATYYSAAGGYFRYAPPTGFKALNQRNLPAIPAAVLDPTDHHIDITVTKSGDTNFTLPWDASTYDTFFEIKRRDAAGDWYQIDGLRGYDKILKSNGTAAETTDANVIGVSGTTCTLKSTLANGTYIISATKAGLSASRQTNTDGSITSTVSRNVDSGFAIVTYTTNNTAGATIGHGLGQVPSMMIFKYRSLASTNWVVYHKNMNASPQNGYINLNTTAAYAVLSDPWNNTAPTSSVITMGAGVGSAGSTNYLVQTAVAYCYADSAIQKSFSYTGNGSADGHYVNLGFECGHSLIKRTDGSSDNWMVMDSARNAYNLTDAYVNPNLSSAEATYGGLDFTATGLKHRTGSTATNVVAGTYIGHAWASVTGKYSNAR